MVGGKNPRLSLFREKEFPVSPRSGGDTEGDELALLAYRVFCAPSH